MKNPIRMNLLNATHVSDRRHRGFRNRQGHAVVNQRVAQRHISGDVPGSVLHGDRLQLKIYPTAVQRIQKLILC